MRRALTPRRFPHTPLPVTRYADGRKRINLGTGNYVGLAGDPRAARAAAPAVA